MSHSLTSFNQSESLEHFFVDAFHRVETLTDSLDVAIDNGVSAQSLGGDNGTILAFAEICSEARLLTGITPGMTPDGAMEEVMEQFLISENTTAEEAALKLYGGMYDIPCPFGSICEGPFRLSCQLLQELPRTLGIGDIHGGAYCPGNQNSSSRVRYENCEVGYYCPNTTTKIICPEGYFCPWKTAHPEIECSRCKEGSKTFVRNTEAFALLLILPIAIFSIIIYRSMRMKKKEQKKKMESLKVQKASGTKQTEIQKELDERLQRMLPKLRDIRNRLKQHTNPDQEGLSQYQDEVQHTDSGLSSTEFGLSISQKDIYFDLGKIFDVLDNDKSEDLTYEELNTILDLSPLQLVEFIRRMNFLSGLPGTYKSVTKPVFQKYFLKVLEESSNFVPTQDEVAMLFDKIVEDDGFDFDDHIYLRRFYDSPIAGFLSDSQIHQMIKTFELIIHGKEGSFRATATSGRSIRRMNSTAMSASSISREEFITHYPTILLQITEAATQRTPLKASQRDNDNLQGDIESTNDVVEPIGGGVDMTFSDLCLEVAAGKRSFNVVDHVSGRLVSGTMTALMGGSGAGKTSLLNALCGRAFYGKVTGPISINGNESSIDEHKSSVGFVPQDDIVYAELTVRENLLFAGQFSLPKGTKFAEIVDLADETMAGLGLTRIADTIVGDVNRRGVSGGEKKRVNIGLELMSKPKILFLDEPTSGLDSSSALLVMTSLRKLVEKNGVTVCSVIHQPRKIIFELFDKVILLGEGGKVVYHGLVSNVEQYFTAIQYELPPGEALADWLIDISSGRIAPNSPIQVGESDNIVDAGAMDQNHCNEVGVDGISGKQLAKAQDHAKARKEMLCKLWVKYFKGLSEKEMEMYLPPVPPYALPEDKVKPPFLNQLVVNLERQWIVFLRNWLTKLVDTAIILFAVIIICVLAGVYEPTVDSHVDVRWEDMVSKTNPPMTQLLQFSARGFIGLMQFAQMIGVIVAVLTSLSATKILTDKQNEFYREASSGYSINAYFLAVNIVATVRHSIEAIVIATFALWLRGTATNGAYFFVHFIMLNWITVSWALLFPIILPRQNVVLFTGFYVTFLSLLFGGAVKPIDLNSIYSNKALEIFCGFFSPLRFFGEGIAVSETRCLPPQTGFADLGPNAPKELYLFYNIPAGINDFEAVTQKSCGGWYWGVLPSFFVGLTIRVIAAGAIHVCNRGKMGEKPLFHQLMVNAKSSDYGLLFVVICFVVVVVVLIALSTYLMLRKVS